MMSDVRLSAFYGELRSIEEDALEKTARAVFYDWDDLGDEQRGELIGLMKEAGLIGALKRGLVGVGLLGAPAVKAEAGVAGARLGKQIASLNVAKKPPLKRAVTAPLPPAAAAKTQGIAKVPTPRKVNVPTPAAAPLGPPKVVADNRLAIGQIRREADGSISASKYTSVRR